MLTARRLFVIPGHLWAVRAAGVSLLRRRSSVPVVFMVAPLGMDRDFAISLCLARLYFALLLRSVMDAAESIRAVSYICGGLVPMFLVGWLMPVVFFSGFYPFVHVLMMYAKNLMYSLISEHTM